MSAVLSVLVPVPVTTANLTSTTVPETVPLWNAGTSYAISDRCRSDVTHRIYENQIAANLNHDPTDILNRVGAPIYWIDVEATNTWKMLDNQVSSQTLAASPLTIVLHPGPFNAVTLAGLTNADNIVVTGKDAPGGNVIYGYTGALENSLPPDYYEYFFSPFEQQTDLVLQNIDQYYNGEITVTITNSSGLIGVGMLALGDLKPLGQTLYGPKVTPKSYSYIAINAYGDAEIIPGKTGKDLQITSWLKLIEANAVLETLLSVLDVPSLIVGTDIPAYSGLRSFGLITGEITYQDEDDCVLAVTVKGLI